MNDIMNDATSWKIKKKPRRKSKSDDRNESFRFLFEIFIASG